MIEIYRRSNTGKNQLINQYDSYLALFKYIYAGDISMFGRDDYDRIDPKFVPVLQRMPDDPYNIGLYCYTIYSDGKFISPDQLVGLRRRYQRERNEAYWKAWGQRSCNRAYGTYRKVRMGQKLRDSQTQDEDYYVKIRASSHSLLSTLDPWDDVYSHNDKSWKTQSKRRRQWKE